MGVKDSSIAVAVLCSYIRELKCYKGFVYVLPQWASLTCDAVILWQLSSISGMHYVFLVVCLTQKQNRGATKFPPMIILWQICLTTLLASEWYVLYTRVQDC